LRIHLIPSKRLSTALVSNHITDHVRHLTPSSAPSSQRPTNILILLHGLGDGHLPFAQLGSQLNLPETACLAIQAPEPLPFEPSSFHWGDDVIFDNTVGTIDPDGGFKKVVPRLVKEIIEDTLVQKCGYKSRELMLFGFGQGGMVALGTAGMSKSIIQLSLQTLNTVSSKYGKGAGRRHQCRWSIAE
jgi:predicted esterase